MFGMSGIASAQNQRQLQRAEEALTEARYQHAWFQSKMRHNPGAFMVERKDGQIIIHAKTRVPRVGRMTPFTSTTWRVTR